MKSDQYPEEFKLTKTQYLNQNDMKFMQKELNKNVYEFKEENPEYEIFDINFIKTGTVQGYLILFWKKIKL
ncbi:MAG: hypothetical protein ACFE8M_08640 [Candidatus Hermodarchaeota archaeon]